MKLKGTQIDLNLQQTFRVVTPFKFNCLSINTAFSKDLSLVVGGQDGVIRIYDMLAEIQIKKPKILLETKGGPIQTLAIHDVTRFYDNDVIVGDSHGTVTVFCNKQILCRHNLAKDNINCLQILTDALGNCSIVCSDDSGNVCAVLPSRELWRININNLSVPKGPSHKTVVTSLLAAGLATSTGAKCSYIVAADDACRLHFIHQGHVVMMINTPAVITAMCTGRFIDTDKLEVTPDAAGGKDRLQVALGSSTGAIYVLHNFTITVDEFANAKYPVTRLMSYPHPTSSLHYLLCAGHFNALHVYFDGKKVGDHETSDWITGMDIASVQKDARPQVVIGCMDNTIAGLQLSNG